MPNTFSKAKFYVSIPINNSKKKSEKREMIPLVYTNSQNWSDFFSSDQKDRNISIFPSDFVQSDPIFAVRVNRG
jgi:hypothetical protein